MQFRHHTKHIVYIQFDNVHFRRDNPNVLDLEQIPNLLNFLEGNGAVLTNHWTPLISHTSVDIVTSLTGVYGDRFGFSIGNSFGLYQNGMASFPSSFTYWTDVLADGKYQMLDQSGKNAPAPWVPFTGAGCDVGAFSIANIEFENVTSDIDNLFGPTSPQAAEAKSNPTKAVADFEGIIVHYAKGTRCAPRTARPDILKDEPGGYNGFHRTFTAMSMFSRRSRQRGRSPISTATSSPTATAIQAFPVLTRRAGSAGLDAPLYWPLALTEPCPCASDAPAFR